MDYLDPIVLIVGGILAISSLIISKKPEAKKYIDKIAPYQALIGVFLLALGIWTLIRSLKFLMDIFKYSALAGVTLWGDIVASILLGFLFGMPQIAKWIPGDSPAEQKAMEFSKKVAPYQTMLGIIGIACGFITLLYAFHILK